ncbi:MAG: hypothetical protein JO194_08520 [Candidatus Eremiobacteraeota bacterium]|nr:hypothetical protein [Candidatus Eremiobacteraeota bacterium]
MALGDSITAGVNVVAPADGGYRRKLSALLTAHDYHVVFVGSRNDFSAGLAQPWHEGWPGYVIKAYPSAPIGQLSGQIAAGAISMDKPDVILLMIGTNDLLRAQAGYAGYSEPAAERNMGALLNEIFAAKPDVRVIVAGIVDSPRLTQCSVDQFDTGSSLCGPSAGGLPALVKRFQARGKSIWLASGMNRALPRTAAYFPDGLHPDDAGYDAMAQVWFRAFQSSLGSPAQVAALTAHHAAQTTAQPAIANAAASLHANAAQPNSKSH